MCGVQMLWITCIFKTNEVVLVTLFVNQKEAYRPTMV